MAKSMARLRLPGGVQRLWNKRLEVIRHNLAREFNMHSFPPRSTQIVNWVHRFTQSAVVILLTYVFLRFLLLKRILGDEASNLVIFQMNRQSWFDLILIILLAGFIVTTVIRIFVPIRFSSKVMWICVTGFGLYLIETYWLNDIQFLHSRIIPGHPHYFALLIVPPVTEVIFRIYHALKKKRIVNHSLFIENQPAQNKQGGKSTRDALVTLVATHLNKAYFERSYSIGLVGNWGVGKTTFLDALRSNLSNCVVIEFNPWLSTGKNSLLQEFIESLKENLAHYDKSISFELDKYLASLVELEKTTRTGITTFVKNLTISDHSSNTEFKRVSHAIERVGRKLVIVIDDLDRLSKEEIIDVLKLIRNTGNFNNTIYISCYDKVYLLHALQHFSKRNLNILLDKFFDVEIPLAPFTEKSIQELLYEKFFIPYCIPKTDSDLVISRINFLLFSQFRETKKFLTSLTLNYLLYGKKLYFHDFFILEMIKVKFPFLADELWRRRDQFFTEDISLYIVKLALTSKESGSDETQVDQYLDESERDEFTKNFLTGPDRAVIKTLLQTLFPGEGLGNPYAIQEPTFFAHYFYASVPDTSTGILNWYHAIRSDTYQQDKFFQGAYDAKKEEEISRALLSDKAQLLQTFGPDPTKLFQFLFFLVDWSNGRISPGIFKDVFDSLPGPDQKTKFHRHLSDTALRLRQITARSYFISVLVRLFVRELSMKPEYADEATLKKVNLDLFEKYLSDVTEFSNEGYQVLYNQVSHLTAGNMVVLQGAALGMVKKFVNQNPTLFLDMLIRGSMIPNEALEFTFAPFVMGDAGIFESKEEFLQFVKSTNYPAYRKKKMVSYVESANQDSQYSRYVFDIAKDQLPQMPIEFSNAWASVPETIRKDIKETNYSYSFDLRNQPVPADYPEFNDHVLDEVHEVADGVVEIVIVPGKDTKFWRFGLKFSKQRQIPEGPPRHAQEYPDVTIAVGEQVRNGAWAKATLLKFEHHHISPQSNSFNDFVYKRSEIRLVIEMRKSPQRFVDIEFFNDKVSQGKRGFVMHDLRYFQLSAWCDLRDFRLSVTITKRMNVVMLEGSQNGQIETD
jgi:hypothetical protein